MNDTATRPSHSLPCLIEAVIVAAVAGAGLHAGIALASYVLANVVNSYESMSSSTVALFSAIGAMACAVSIYSRRLERVTLPRLRWFGAFGGQTILVTLGSTMFYQVVTSLSLFDASVPRAGYAPQALVTFFSWVPKMFVVSVTIAVVLVIVANGVVQPSAIQQARTNLDGLRYELTDTAMIDRINLAQERHGAIRTFGWVREITVDRPANREDFLTLLDERFTRLDQV